LHRLDHLTQFARIVPAGPELLLQFVQFLFCLVDSAAVACKRESTVLYTIEIRTNVLEQTPAVEAVTVAIAVAISTPIRIPYLIPTTFYPVSTNFGKLAQSRQVVRQKFPLFRPDTVVVYHDLHGLDYVVELIRIAAPGIQLALKFVQLVFRANHSAPIAAEWESALLHAIEIRTHVLEQVASIEAIVISIPVPIAILSVRANCEQKHASACQTHQLMFHAASSASTTLEGSAIGHINFFTYVTVTEGRRLRNGNYPRSNGKRSRNLAVLPMK
jgi:hypothetical protein